MLFHTVLLLSSILLAVNCKVDNKAASSLNIGCQCSSLVWEDSNRSVLLLSSILLAVNCTVDNKAGSPSLNSDCQCSSLIWEESYCISPDTMGPASAMWISSTTPARTWSHLPGSPPTPGPMRLLLLLQFSL